MWIKALSLLRGSHSVCMRRWIITQRSKMAGNTQSESGHLQRTQHNTRDPALAQAQVIHMRDLSPTVKGLTLKIQDAALSFKSGQWVDFHIPSLEVVAGYSMCSTPSRLQTEGEMELAVKFSTHPPAYWVHNQCKVGSAVQVRVGGDFFYDPICEETQGQPSGVLLIAGGVGINPLFSMFNHQAALQLEGVLRPRQVALLFSASTRDELIFKKDIESTLFSQNTFSAQYFVTQESEQMLENISGRRISRSDLETSIENLGGPSGIQCYICGPVTMIDSMEAHLKELAVLQSAIHYEKWW